MKFITGLVFSIFLSILLIPNISSAEITNVGRAVFGIQHKNFQCSKFIHSMKRVRNWHISFLFNTFGNSNGCIRRVMKNRKLKTIQINLINEPCVGFNRCQSYEFLHGVSKADYDAALRREDPALRAEFDRYSDRAASLLYENLRPDTQCVVSPGLESNVSVEAGKTLVKWTREKFPNCKIVWNPKSLNTNSYKTGADAVEGHGVVPPLKVPCVVNLDGTGISFPSRRISDPNHIDVTEVQDFISTYSFCEVVYLWVPEDNCFSRIEQGQPWKEPRKRSCDPGRINDLVADEIVKAQKHGRPIKPPPSNIWTDEENLSLEGCKKELKAVDGDKKGFLFKQSDGHTGAVILLPGAEENIKKVEVFHKGKRILSFKRYGIFTEDNYKNRPLWRTDDRLNIKVKNLPYHVVVKEDDGKICRSLDNPKIRID